MLPPSRVPVGNPARDPDGGDRSGQPGLGRYKSDTTATAGGVGLGLDRHELDVTFTVSNTPAAGLQAIQTFMGTRLNDPLTGAHGGGKRVGTYTWKTGGVNWDAFVDGGKNSPFVDLAGHVAYEDDKTRPYFLSKDQVAARVDWRGDNGTIKVIDHPDAVSGHDEAHFETAVIAIGAGSDHSDKVLKVFKWGWTEQGDQPVFEKGTKIAGKDSGIQVMDGVSPEFKNILKHDYPSYRLS